MATGGVSLVVPAMRYADVAWGAAGTRSIAAFWLAWLLALCAAPLLDAVVAMVRGGERSAAWTRVVVEGAVALVVIVPACLLVAVAWPALSALGLAASVGLLAGLLRWRPAPPRPRPHIPILLLLLGGADWTTRAHELAPKAQRETKAA
jgi:hypothetical protein